MCETVKKKTLIRSTQIKQLMLNSLGWKSRCFPLNISNKEDHSHDFHLKIVLEVLVSRKEIKDIHIGKEGRLSPLKVTWHCIKRIPRNPQVIRIQYKENPKESIGNKDLVRFQGTKTLCKNQTFFCVNRKNLRKKLYFQQH